MTMYHLEIQNLEGNGDAKSIHNGYEAVTCVHELVLTLGLEERDGTSGSRWHKVWRVCSGIILIKRWE